MNDSRRLPTVARAFLVTALFTIAMAAIPPFARGASPEVSAPPFCSGSTNAGARALICRTRSLWVHDALLEWDLQAAAEALGEAGTPKAASALDSLKPLAKEWREEPGKGCAWNLPEAEAVRCVAKNYRTRSIELAVLQRNAGLDTDEMAQAHLRENEFVRAESEAASQAKAKLEQERQAAERKKEAEVEELRQKFERQRALATAEQDATNMRMLTLAVLGLVAGLLIGISVYVASWIRVGYRASNSVPPVQTLTEMAVAPSLAPAGYGFLAAAIGAYALGAAYLPAHWSVDKLFTSSAPPLVSAPAGASPTAAVPLSSGRATNSVAPSSSSAAPSPSQPSQRVPTESEVVYAGMMEVVATAKKRPAPCFQMADALEKALSMYRRHPQVYLDGVSMLFADMERYGCT